LLWEDLNEESENDEESVLSLMTTSSHLIINNVSKIIDHIKFHLTLEFYLHPTRFPAT